MIERWSAEARAWAGCSAAEAPTSARAQATAQASRVRSVVRGVCGIGAPAEGAIVSGQHEGGRRAALDASERDGTAGVAPDEPVRRAPPGYFAAEYRCPTTSQLTTAHQASRYAGRLFWYLR